MEAQEQESDNRKDKQAGFRPQRTSGDGMRAVEGGVQQTSFGKFAAIESGVDVNGGQVESCMKSDGKAQVSQAAKRKADEQGQERCACPVGPALVGLGEEMQGAKQERDQPCGRPEPYSHRQRELRVATEEYFFGKADHQIGSNPEQGVMNQCSASDVKASRRITVGQRDEANQQRDGSETESASGPEPASKNVACRKVVIRPSTVLNPGHQ